MFKKIILLLFIFSPIVFISTVGLPVLSSDNYQKKVLERQNVIVSRRCFTVGDYREFLGCFDHDPRITTLEIGNETLKKLNTQSPIFTFIFLSSFALLVLLVLFLFLQKEE